MTEKEKIFRIFFREKTVFNFAAKCDIVTCIVPVWC